MALDLDALVSRVRAIMTTGAGSIRTINTSRFRGDFHTGLSDAERAKRAVAAAPNAVYDITARPLGLNAASPPRLHSMVLYDVDVTIVVARASTFTEATIDAARDAAINLAGEDFDVLCQALNYPGNVSGASLASDMLRPEGAPSAMFRVPGAGQFGIIETTSRFRGIVAVTQAVS